MTFKVKQKWQLDTGEIFLIMALTDEGFQGVFMDELGELTGVNIKGTWHELSDMMVRFKGKLLRVQ